MMSAFVGLISWQLFKYSNTPIWFFFINKKTFWEIYHYIILSVFIYLKVSDINLDHPQIYP